MSTHTHIPQHATGETPDRAPRQATETETVLRMSGVDLEYPDGTAEDGSPQILKALDGVDFSARRSQVCALVGESGSGKSSLLSVAATLVAPTRGSVNIQGTETSTLTDAERATLRREQVGVIFQQPNLIPSLTAREQLLVAEHLRGVRGRKLTVDATRRADELLERVGLAGLGDRRLHQLSGGQRQRVNIARALMGHPALLLADEPTSALDQRRSQEVVQLLGEVTREFDVATVLVTHQTELLDATDRVVTMSDGRLTEGLSALSV